MPRDNQWATGRTVGPNDKWVDLYGTVLREACLAADNQLFVNSTDAFVAGSGVLIGAPLETQSNKIVSSIDANQGIISLTTNVGQAYSVNTPVVVPLVGGADGAPGVDGQDGADGTDGTDGTVWYEGTGGAAAFLGGGTGVTGDFYLDDSTGDVYKNNGGLWGIVANILGPQGDTGAASVPDFSANPIYVSLSSGNHDDWVPTNWDTTVTSLGISVTAGAVLRGLDSTGWADGQVMPIRLVGGAGDLTIAHNNAGSSTHNQITCPGATNFTVRSGGGVLLLYGSASSGGTNRWRVMAP